jgi:hypothetical protein
MKNKSSVSYLHKITNENTQKLAKALKDLKIEFRHLIAFKNSLIDSQSLDLQNKLPFAEFKIIRQRSDYDDIKNALGMIEDTLLQDLVQDGMFDLN